MINWYLPEADLNDKTIEISMSQDTKLSYVFIKNHLMDTTHPLNMIASVFVESYVNHYSAEILNNSEMY